MRSLAAEVERSFYERPRALIFLNIAEKLVEELGRAG
jgi:hypothetical protein